MALVRLGQRGTVVIPKELRKGLNADSLLEVVRRDDGVIELRPRMVIDPTQAWFWTEEWQKGEREVDEDYAAGRYKTFNSGEEFLAWLDEADQELDQVDEERRA